MEMKQEPPHIQDALELKRIKQGRRSEMNVTDLDGRPRCNDFDNYDPLLAKLKDGAR